MFSLTLTLLLLLTLFGFNESIEENQPSPLPLDTANFTQVVKREKRQFGCTNCGTSGCSYGRCSGGGCGGGGCGCNSACGLGYGFGPGTYSGGCNGGRCRAMCCQSSNPLPCVGCGFSLRGTCCSCCMPACRESCVRRGGCNACTGRFDYYSYDYEGFGAGFGSRFGRGFLGRKKRSLSASPDN